jgi:hypothetical protein
LWTATRPISGSSLPLACCRPFCLSSLCLLKFVWRSAPCSLLLPPSPVCFCVPPPLLCASFQFFVYCSVFFCGEVSFFSRGLCWFIPAVAGGTPRDVVRSPVWSAECFPSRFGVGISQQQQPSCFLSVMWHGEAFYGLGV